MMAVSLLASILFLGGWNGPVPVATWLGFTFEHGPIWGHVGNVLGVANVIIKGVVGVTVMMWVRWTLPRLRIDQVITTCLKYCVPIAAVCVLGATWGQFMWPNGLFMETPFAVYQLREKWPEKAAAAPPTAVAAHESGEAI
jgi:NADH-quinone oxidoreductase subunit H